MSLDTIYATVGRKPALLRELVETAISGTDQPVPAEQRDYVIRIGAGRHRDRQDHHLRPGDHRDPAADGTGIPGPARRRRHRRRTAPGLWTEIATRRATNMRGFAADLRSTGELRDDLTDDQVADIIWSMNAAEYWDLLVRERGWTPDQFRDWLTDAWTRLLLNRP